MFDHGQALRAQKGRSVVLDLETVGWKHPFYVECKILPSGHIEISRVDAFIEQFQIYKNLDATDLCFKGEEWEDFKDKIRDWDNAQQVTDLNRRRARKVQFNNDDLDIA